MNLIWSTINKVKTIFKISAGSRQNLEEEKISEKIFPSSPTSHESVPGQIGWKKFDVYYRKEHSKCQRAYAGKLVLNYRTNLTSVSLLLAITLVSTRTWSSWSS